MRERESERERVRTAYALHRREVVHSASSVRAFTSRELTDARSVIDR